MKIDEYGNSIYEYDDILLLKKDNVNTSNIEAEEDSRIEIHNKFCKTIGNDKIDMNDDAIKFYHAPDCSIEEFDKLRQSQWLIPDEYFQIDIDSFLYESCKNDSERQRVQEEMESFRKHDFIPILHLMIYLVDYFRSNNLLWGIGRGSCVSSFVLYLIGIHRINPMDYDLDQNEFFKDGEI